jgi:hypothetical protein
MMSLRSVAAGLSLVAIFSVSFAIMWREHDTAGSPSPSPEAQAIIAADAAAGAGRAAEVGVPDVGRDNPDPRAPESASSTPAPATTPVAANVANDSGMAELPVEIHFRKRPDQGRIEGSVVNASAAELVIEAVVFSRDTAHTQTFQLLVAPYAGKAFGLDGELDLHSGDQITLKSSPYREKVATIP